MEFYKSKYSSKKERGSRRSSGLSRPFRNSKNQKPSESAIVNCADCGIECKIPFVPKTGRPVYCSGCFRQSKPQDSRESRPSRNGRDSRYSGNERRPKPKTSKSERFQKKQEELYSNGSEKFYSALKEKLFEILGGKVCSSCGFRAECALGFSNICDDELFDTIRRGGSASSWRKYISDPDLAREELRVLCLNCNEIRQPTSKPKLDRPKRKKSKFFPRKRSAESHL